MHCCSMSHTNLLQVHYLWSCDLSCQCLSITCVAPWGAGNLHYSTVLPCDVLLCWDIAARQATDNSSSSSAVNPPAGG
jgi:hypothetical protein